MTYKSLHIVCFDVPYPVNHGGFFDLFFKIKSLHEAGITIYLHCFEYGRGQQLELEKYCHEVNYYPRKKLNVSFRLPFIVTSRINKQLTENVSKDNHPILLEGTHTTYILYKNLFPGRRLLYRLHNIEHIYYRNLYRSEKNLLKKSYFYFESRLLKRYEKKVIPKAAVAITVSEKDTCIVKRCYPDANVFYLPIFLPFKDVRALTGKGNFLLYHGNLSVPENEQAVFLLLDIVKTLPVNLVVAGRRPSKRLISYLGHFENVVLKPDPSDNDLKDLIQEAQINFIYSLNATGIKVKFIHALFYGRHCMANEAALPGRLFNECCYVVENKEEMKTAIMKLMKQPFTTQDVEKRKALLLDHFDTKHCISKLNAWLW